MIKLVERSNGYDIFVNDELFITTSNPLVTSYQNFEMLSEYFNDVNFTIYDESGKIIYNTHRTKSDDVTKTIDKFGTIVYKNSKGELHREDGPAVELTDGTKYWMINDQYHREDGPAIENANGDKHWYLNGEQLTQEEFIEKTKNFDNDIDFDKLNDKVNFVANTGKYKNTFNNDKVFETDNVNIEPTVVNKTTTSNAPVGDVDKPNVGDLIYIDSVKGILSTILGGVCTVSMVYESEHAIVTDTIEYESFGFDIEEDEFDGEVEENNILVEIEEFPGRYFSWSLLRDKQNELQKQFGYTPARLIN